MKKFKVTSYDFVNSTHNKPAIEIVVESEYVRIDDDGLIKFTNDIDEKITPVAAFSANRVWYKEVELK